jgi:site-specific DNA-methyltransferase (adenine-specific)
MNPKILNGDCREHLREIKSNSVDSVITDPPYGLEFMGKEWDKLWTKRDARTDSSIGRKNDPFIGARVDKYMTGLEAQHWHYEWLKLIYRVLKPGGHLLVFGGTRTYHRMACAVEDAGFEIRDCITWIYGSGFPKSLDISKAIDKMYGEEREVVAPNPNDRPNAPPQFIYQEERRANPITSPSTPEAQTWDGWGTGLKPAVEFILVSRKPISEKNISLNVLKHGTGGLNIDDCRIGTKEELGRMTYKSERIYKTGFDDKDGWIDNSNNKGRFPSNLILDPESAKVLDEQSGVSKSQGGTGRTTQSIGGRGAYQGGDNRGFFHYQDLGGASRFFYVAKASSSERYFICRVCDTVDNNRLKHKKHSMRCNDCNVDYEPEYLEGKQTTSLMMNIGGHEKNPQKYTDEHKNHNTESNLIGHPTQKPVQLIEYLVKLVTPEGGIVLDPFMGSGTTCVACVRLRRESIGIEKEPDYVRIAKERINKEPLLKIRPLNSYDKN